MPLDTARTISNLRSLTTTFDNSVAAASPFYPQISTRVPSNGAEENYGFLGNVPGMREWLGDRVFHSLRAARFAIANRLWENSVRIELTDIEDDQLGKYGIVLQEMANEAVYHPDELMFDLIVNGDSAECFDGQNFYDTDHAWGDSGTQDNDLTHAAATGTAPTETEFRDAYHEMRAAMLGFKRDNGKPFHRPTVTPMNDLLLMVPTGLQETAEAALMRTVGTAGEQIVVLDRPKIVTIPHFTESAVMYLHRIGQPLKPFVFQDRRALRREMKGANDIEFKDVKFMTDRRYNVGYFAWWNSVRMEFT